MNVLIITPDFTLNGANIALYELMKIWKAMDYDMDCIGHESGKLLSIFKEYSNCRIFPTVPTDKNIKKELINNYDFVFLNSSSVHLYAMIFQNMNTPVFWWFHEGPEQLSHPVQFFTHPGLLSSNFHFLSVTPKVKKGLMDLFGIESFVLEEPIEDFRNSSSLSADDKVVFYIPAAYIYIKGQDILLNAISKIPGNLQEKTRFIFSGYQLDSQKEYYESIKKTASKIKYVEFLESLPRAEVYKIYEKATAVIAPSRIDSANATIMEGLMFEKFCILSDGCGIKDYLKDCVNAFIFPNENEEELLKRILLVIAEHNNLASVKSEGRKIYEEVFHPDVISKKWNTVLSQL